MKSFNDNTHLHKENSGCKQINIFYGLEYLKFKIWIWYGIQISKLLFHYDNLGQSLKVFKFRIIFEPNFTGKVKDPHNKSVKIFELSSSFRTV